MPPSVSIVIQAHPARQPLAEALCLFSSANLIAYDHAALDEGPNPWRGYRNALERAPAADHVLVLQDDTLVCKRFRPTVELALQHQSENVIAWYVGGMPAHYAARVRQACQEGKGWTLLPSGFSSTWFPVVATSWPAALVPEFLAWVDAQPWGPRMKSDDEVVGRFLNGTGQRALACSPSLVQHPDAEPSLIGDRARAGGDDSRVAALYLADQDPACIDWHHGP